MSKPARIAFTVHLPSRLYRWVTDIAAARATTITAAIHEIIDDRRTVFGLSPQERELLRDERAALGLSLRDQIRYALWCRYRTLKAKDPAFNRASGDAD